MSRQFILPIAALPFVALSLLAGDAGIGPRASASDYSAQQHGAGATFGATVLGKEQIRHTFTTDLADGYIVVEVGVFPDRDGQIHVSTQDFILTLGGSKNGSSHMIRAEEPATVAAELQRQNTPPVPSRSGITIYPSTTIGYGSGPGVNGGRNGGWETGAGVGVGIGGSPYPQGPAPASTNRDRRVMKAELSDKSLPDGIVSKPAAGFLYFPSPTKKMSATVYHLSFYYGNGGRLVLDVPPPKH